MKKLSIKTIFILMVTATGVQASAQDVSDETKNPYGLVYRGAITENRQGAVNIHQVTQSPGLYMIFSVIAILIS